MLQNAYLLAKIGADTAENEQHFAEKLPKIGNYPTGPPLATHGAALELVSGVRERYPGAARGLVSLVPQAEGCAKPPDAGDTKDTNEYY